ncbi:MAG TPA: hypothetical protein VEQ62_17990 [Stellaceae bacterium]|nr:hypothetical protein [Stellaceae bacterium]
MSIMITGVSVAQSAPVGTVVGYLHCYNSGLTVPCNFVAKQRGHGTFTAGVDQAGVMRIWRIE